jgi:hypothetical protein
LHVLPFDPTTIVQSLLQAVDRPQRCRGEHPDVHGFCRIGGEHRARDRSAADRGNHIAAPHSMTSSA